MSLSKPTLLGRSSHFSCPFFEVVTDELEFENGTHWNYSHILAGEGVVIVALDEDKHILLLREYRHPVGETLIGLPAGGVDEHPTPLAAAQAELAEEAGAEARDWKQLGRFYPTAGSSDNVGHIFLATGLTRVERSIQGYEQIEVMRVPFAKAVDMVEAGEILDAWAIIPIYRVARSLRL